MYKSLELLLKFVCLVLGLWIIFQFYGIFGEEDPLEDLSANNILEDLEKAGDAAPKTVADKNKSPSLAAEFKSIETSGIFGKVQVKIQPTLMGIAGDYALLRAPDGQMDMVPAGGELGGVKILAIGMNRVLIEYRGKKQELILFTGLEGESLLEPTPKKEERKPK